MHGRAYRGAPGPRHRAARRQYATGVKLGVGAAIVGGEVIDGDVEIEDGEIVAVGLPGGGSGIAIPGLVDLQVNGYAGVDVATARRVDELLDLGRALAADGVLWYQPTVVTASIDDMCARARAHR